LKTVTLGCKVNQYETQYAREGFTRLGFRDPAEDEPADLILVNTCSVTAESEAKCRKIIRRLAKKNPRAEIIVMGCYATRAPEEVAALPNIVEVVKDKRELPKLFSRRGLPEVPSGISTFAGRHRAWVKIQDGCREKCAYCIIPLVRPVLVSRPVEDVLSEIRCLVDAGFAEIVLTGIHLGHYGLEVNQSGYDLSGLLRRIVALEGEFRVRLSSIEAAEVTPEVLDVMAEYPRRICPHLHLPLQSGSDEILKKMNRRYTSAEYIDRCKEIRQRLDQPALGTDVIVGFPGESEADFSATCRVVEAAGFSRIHVFRFSPRPATAAAAMPNRLPQRVVQHRAAKLANLEKQLARKYLESLQGKTIQTLVEGALPEVPKMLLATADRYFNLEFPGTADLIGKLIDITYLAEYSSLKPTGCARWA
ncbi:MAG: tRNA (N(6)-L-threonylcarbamoyladenosine(37)-C(2))-methylthiotransferase MtaB, partial [Thermoguttaceae bacterium]